MLYVYLPSVDQRDALLGILDFFNHHKLFLECAIPAAVTMMEDRFSIQVYTAKQQILKNTKNVLKHIKVQLRK